ncbi:MULTISPECIES: DUF4097 family beta strand repeat-containing protein [unclassified Streptomyces]|uniref:DUF4097 family beta strand repeat-containing protein n=1 Tax=unclassified Streptomyces TaxID=2593676 RepID=UPI001F047238|nr:MULTISPECIES: DUF4097 family beta strand repeat-containing protein [unclassified Streptomyces]MCH0564658.1 DUF4097 family beta strand repeat protein [Streptomyces sp. MUM 2J]MCH0570358.1 DUF4097 family beta strand repeat protein [Streptomyces sp. MUM 136J]
MPSFDTPEAISVTAHVYSGSILFTTGDRTSTVVKVEPRDPKHDEDARAAERTEVAYASGALTVRTPKANLIGRSGTVDVTVELPTGSNIDVSGAGAQVLGEGRLGDVRLKTTSGDVRLDTTGPLQLSASHGSITVNRVEGTAEITTNSGNLRVGLVDGPAVLKNAHGSTTVDAVTGELRVNGVNGGVDIARAEASVTGTTTNGHLRVADVARGSVHLETANGPIEVGIREGTAAWLDVASKRGQVRNTLATTDTPEQTEETVSVHARSNWGNIDIRRARA